MSVISSLSLRLLALACMTLDHIGLALLPDFLLLRCIGRIAFPLFCFLLVQGYLHTASVKRYGLRLFGTALVSEIPFDLLIFGKPFCMAEQNVVFSLFLSLLLLYALDCVRKDSALLPLAVLAGILLFSMAFSVSFGWLGPVLCFCFRYSDRDRRKQALLLCLCVLAYSASLFLSGVSAEWCAVSFCAVLSAFPVLLYNGKSGTRRKAFRAGSYLFYPVHLLLLAGLRLLRPVPPYFLQELLQKIFG